ncbi:MAG: hypothetical protein ACPG5B_02855 [Chitinophagales bacterium]
MSWFFIIAIIVLGLILLIIEFFLLPGTTVAGIIGGIFIVVGNLLSFFYLGGETGSVTLLVSLAISVLMFIIGYKTLGSRGMVLEANLSNSKAPKINYAANTRPLRVGDKGFAHGDIKPHGRAIINDLTYSVKSMGEFISDNREIIIVEVSERQIVVKQV